MDQEAVNQYIQDMPDDVLSRIMFSMPWQYDTSEGGYKDPDGFDSTSLFPASKDDSQSVRQTLQAECWAKFNKNPQINTAVRGLVGRICGWGFETSSEIAEIDELIEEIELDPRNRLYNFLPKYVGRSYIEGELFLLLTCHSDGFIEIDYIDPATINSQGDDDTGIIFHPDKTLMPLMYLISTADDRKMQIPSIFIARYPELFNIARKHKDFMVKYANSSRNRKKKFRKFNGFYRFIVAWDRSFLTRRAVSYIRTIIEWLNHYENLKKYEIDHKKSSGAYVWVFRITEPRAFKQWLSLTDEERRKTGIASKKTPGGSIVLPPGVECDAKNPNLTKISEQDTDILDMISSGLNEPDDVMMSRAKGTYANLRATRGPMNDRVADEMEWFYRFYRFDFWDSIFFLRSELTNFKYIHRVREAVSFDKNGEPKFANRKRRACQLIDVNFPTSESIDYESRAKGLMGTKHGPTSEVLGVPYSEVARRMGFGNYGRLRLRHATEKEKYPELIYTMDAESVQEKAEGESIQQPSKKKEQPKKGE